jgi:serine/threonine protein kinase
MEFGLKRLEFLKGLKFIETPSYPEGSCYPERSTGLKDLIRLMLTVDPEKRISFKEILKHPYFKKTTIERNLLVEGSERYEIQSYINHGQFGHVFVAKDKTDNELYAIKVINKRKLERANISSKASREYEVLARLNHPNIIKIFDVFQSKSSLNLVLEYCDMGTLEDMIIQARKNKFFFEENIIKNILQSLCDVFIYTQQTIKQKDNMCFVYRDMKPANILIKNKLIKLGDFGQARFFTEFDTTFTAGLGTIMYSSPELLGERNYDQSTDVWSVGNTKLIFFFLNYFI